MNTVTLPWPPSELSPNARVHWAQRSRVAKKYREACYVLCKRANLVAPQSERIVLMADFYPPDRRHRDDDNMIASFKSGRDGIADALGVDDNRFILTPLVVREVRGWVVVTLLESKWTGAQTRD